MGASADHGTLLERWLLLMAAVYLALIPVAAMTAIRSIAFASAAVLALAVIRDARRARARAVPLPGTLLPLVLVAIIVWSAMSLAWSVRPAYTLQELRGEIMWDAVTVLIFYVAAGVPRAWAILTATALGSFAVSAVIALATPLVAHGRSAEFWYVDTGYFSTLIVLIAPIVLTVPERAQRRAAVVATIVLLALALAAARQTQNRMVFIALAAAFAVAAALAAIRWRDTLSSTPLRWGVALMALAIALGALFIDAARDKALRDFPPQTTVAQTIVEDPRLPLWDATAERIRMRPWTGYGFGRAILSPELRAALHDDLFTFTHPHNLFASQWLQTGAIGVALITLLLAALVARFASFYRSADDRLAFVGLVGLALVAGFVVKNLTDDFLFRASAREFYALNALLVGWGTRLASGANGAANGRANGRAIGVRHQTVRDTESVSGSV